MRPLNILIWHVHGSYLYYLTQAPHNFYLPSKPDRKGDYIGRYGHLPWGENVHDVPVEEVRNLDLDVIIFQLPHQYQEEQYRILSEEQRRLPKIYLQHDPPNLPTDAKHFVDDHNVLVVHVTPYNQLMWDSGDSPTCVIDHGVIAPKNVQYTGELRKGLAVINHLKQRGRKLGRDIYEAAHHRVPLSVVGMAAEQMPGGIREVKHRDLFAFESHFRFFFNPIRYSSMPLSLCEAMMIGMPVIALATTEIPTVIKNGVNGFCDTRLDVLIGHMEELLRDHELAVELGKNARKCALERFNIQRFVNDWNTALSLCIVSPRRQYTATHTQTTGG
jgi:glycosyltransferase involved in cell wall biosynthesis